TQRRVNEERLRIARELHDVVSHSISLINVQAGAAAHVIDEQPEKAKEALQVIKKTSGDAMRELHAIVGVLRPLDEAHPRTPPPAVTASMACVSAPPPSAAVLRQDRARSRASVYAPRCP